MELMNPNNLRPHPRNNEFFDDMDGQKWKDFLQSVRTSGIIEPIIVTQDLVIVSGHQRVRAAKAIGLMKIAVEVRHYENDDKVLKDLIETNIMQRGIGNTNPIKLAKCIVELERILGIRNGGDRKSESHNVTLKTQDDLAEQLKMSKMQLSRYKKLLDLVPELQSAVETGMVSATNATAILAKLPECEQKAIAEQIVGTDGKVSKQELERLKAENEKLRNRKPEVVERVVEKRVEVVPDNYESIKKENAFLLKERQNAIDGQRLAETKLKELEEKMREPEAEREDEIKRSAIFFCAGVSNFIERYGGYIWLSEEINNMEASEREGYMRAVKALKGWIYQMEQNIQGV